MADALRRCVIALMFALASTAAAQSFPSRPILIVVPYGAGSAPDFIARANPTSLMRPAAWAPDFI